MRSRSRKKMPPGLNLSDRVQFLKSNLLENVEGAFDLIVANLPYIATQDRHTLSREVLHDPEVALFAGERGDELVRELIDQAPARLRSGWNAGLGNRARPERGASFGSGGKKLPRHLFEKRLCRRDTVPFCQVWIRSSFTAAIRFPVRSRSAARKILRCRSWPRRLLTREPCIVHGVPDLSDTHYMLQILTHLGAQVERASGTVSVTAEKIQSVAPYDVVRKMRASVCVLGPLLGRCKEATVALPGGCVIGDRPIDLHLKGFEALGAAVRVEGGDIKVFAPKLTGAVINMQGKFGPTVLGTDNVMMAAVLAEGVTVIEGAAQEPEVVDLANFLNKMGAKIEGAGTRRIIIEGVPELHGAEHGVIPDRIEAGTFLVAGAIAGKGVTVKRVEPEHVRAVTDALASCGFHINIGDHAISILPNGDASALELTTEPYPGFPD